MQVEGQQISVDDKKHFLWSVRGVGEKGRGISQSPGGATVIGPGATNELSFGRRRFPLAFSPTR
jgi:hypothetical protein